MYFVRLLFLLFTVGLAANAHAQLGISAPITIAGKVTDAGTGEVIQAATIVNTSTQESSHTNENGAYSIFCHPGDQLAVNYLGYKSALINISAGSELIPINISLKRQNFELNEFIYRPKYTPYQADSIARASTYQRTLSRGHEGSAMSPVTWLAERISHKSKQRFRFQKDFARLEDERFIETRYSPQLVTQMTYLTGDSLAHFMNTYIMPFDYARSASELELKMWIRTNYRDWKAKGFPMPKLSADTVSAKANSNAVNSSK